MATLGVKVKRLEVHVGEAAGGGGSGAVEDLLQLALQHLLLARMVHQVEQDDCLVLRQQAAQVPTEDLQLTGRLAEGERRRRLVPQVRQLAPVQRNGAAKLHEGGLLTLEEHNLFRFHKVGSKAVLVGTAREHSRSGAVYAPSTDDDQGELS